MACENGKRHSVVVEVYVYDLFYHGATATSGPRPPDHTQTHHTRYDSSARVISPTQRPLPDKTQHSQQIQPCPRLDSNPQSQQASGPRPTPSTARPLESAPDFRLTKQLSTVNYSLALRENLVYYTERTGCLQVVPNYSRCIRQQHSLCHKLSPFP